ncbi:MAG: HAMP domain-containing sensor histidine kinase [Arcobacteraceae bacterium]|nr:HAMP domain-containing sensor histidine kinase [Arcobacteraceae bacterium]
MSSKYKNFLISNYIIVGFIILITLATHYIFISQVMFSQALFFPITIFLVFGGLFLYKYLSQSIFDELFKSDTQIDDMIKKTLHELNTPVATIKMNKKMLEKNITSEKDIKRLQRIEESCENLLSLYQYMEYEISSKIDKIKSQKFDILEIAIKSISKVEDIKQTITIENNIKSDIVEGDMYGFIVVLDNLLSNAIKYNKQNGKIILSNENHILKVEDTGCGIDTKNIFKIYDKYFQIDIENQGIGLGLSVVKEYCDKNNIIIKIDSQEGMGTTFYLNYEKILG